MAHISSKDMHVIEDALGMSSGYVMDLSNREFAEIVARDARWNADAPELATRGNSKANRLRRFLELSSDEEAASLLRVLWEIREYRAWTPGDVVEARPSQVRALYMGVVERLELLAGRSDTAALERFAESATLEELIAAINRDVSAGRHAAALDRLHTYCMKRFMYLVTETGLPCGRNAPLQSRVGKWIEHIKASRELRPITQEILDGAGKVLQHFNDIRNKNSFAHDNDIVRADEARLIFETVISILRFVAAIEADGGGSKTDG
jgi:hypothetical protein